MGKKMFTIMDDAQSAANQSVQNLIKARNADKIPAMMPPDHMIQQTFMVSLVENAIRGYNSALMAALKEQGIEIPDICEE